MGSRGRSALVLCGDCGQSCAGAALRSLRGVSLVCEQAPPGLPGHPPREWVPGASVTALGGFDNRIFVVDYVYKIMTIAALVVHYSQMYA